jgi:hypothetical protein
MIFSITNPAPGQRIAVTRRRFVRQPRTGEIPLRRLVKEALRMRPSRLIVGEVRQAECLDPSRCRLSILGLIAYFLQLDLWTRTGVGVIPRERGRKTLFTNLCDF